MIDLLINKFSQQNNYLFQKRNTDNQLETNLESVKSKESAKSKKKNRKNNDCSTEQQNARHWRKGK